ncbi:hypothetical protein [Streptomyces sp. NPDC101132]|uniref:hypothetical protein n=1 Tax=Streptomyces sp. NPDC101132 TaxID=3366110 RepID=UPI00382AD765
MSQPCQPAEVFVGHLAFLPQEQSRQGAGRGRVTRPAYAAFQAGRAYPAFQARAAYPGGADRLPRAGRPAGGAHPAGGYPAGGAYPALPSAEQAVLALRVAAARLRRAAWCVVRGRIPPAPVPAAVAAGRSDPVAAAREAVRYEAFVRYEASGRYDAPGRPPSAAWSPFSWSAP